MEVWSEPEEAAWSAGVPAVRQQFVDVTVKQRRQPREDITQIGPRGVAVELGRLQQAHDDGGAHHKSEVVARRKAVGLSE